MRHSQGHTLCFQQNSHRRKENNSSGHENPCGIDEKIVVRSRLSSAVKCYVIDPEWI